MNNERGTASISDCGRYRYRLTRRWGNGSVLVWIMFNPSMADASRDDATIRRVRGFTKREGYGGFIVVNVWALRATDPKELRLRRGGYETKNIAHVERAVRRRDVIAAWGANVYQGVGLKRICFALQGAASLRCLGLTKGGEPRHPLRLRKDTPLVPWSAGRRK